MKKNVGSADKIIRIIIAAILITLYFTNIATGVAGILCLVGAAIALLTAFLNLCPLYMLLGIKTCKIKKQD